MTDKLKHFQEDLRNGMSISKALRKHNLTFKETVDELKGHHQYPKKRPESQYGKYIYKFGNKYVIRKYIDGEDIRFARCNTHEEAIRIRDELEKNGWKQ